MRLFEQDRYIVYSKEGGKIRTLNYIHNCVLDNQIKNVIIEKQSTRLSNQMIIQSSYWRLYKYLNVHIVREKKYCAVLIGLGGRVFANGPGSIPSCITPKNLKMILDTSLLNTQQYKVCIKDKVEQSRERSNTLLYTS